MAVLTVSLVYSRIWLPQSITFCFTVKIPVSHSRTLTLEPSNAWAQGVPPTAQQGAATELPRKLTVLHSFRKYPLPSHSPLNSRHSSDLVYTAKSLMPWRGVRWDVISETLKKRPHFSWCCTRAPVPSQELSAGQPRAKRWAPPGELVPLTPVPAGASLWWVRMGRNWEPSWEQSCIPQRTLRSKSAWVGVGSRQTALEMGSSEGKISERVTELFLWGPSPLTCGIWGTSVRGVMGGSRPRSPTAFPSQGRGLPAKVWAPYPSSSHTGPCAGPWKSEPHPGGRSLGCLGRWAHLPAQAASSATLSEAGQGPLAFSQSLIQHCAYSQLTVLWVLP